MCAANLPDGISYRILAVFAVYKSCEGPWQRSVEAAAQAT